MYLKILLLSLKSDGTSESPSLVLVINDTKLLMPCVKCFELSISNTCDEGVMWQGVVATRSQRDGAWT
jgi:hypothetical protein